ncbi:helix-turn-helix domain-containing protein [Acutalibacter caecimuris]|uniref:helix-turn-helix domain-containing protein n=1 Tax=Acutalibacter caecimuris TaxID=3093657 RepID=UPI002AC923B7|nr:helix-turn-helix domain-containing protein [Acutalibacter sp. M00118]
MKVKLQRKEMLSRTYLWSFFALVIIIDSLITVALFSVYSAAQLSTATNNSVGQLEQVCTSTDILFESMEAVVNQLANDSDTATFLLDSSTNRLREAAVGQKIRTICTANPYLRYITLYNDTSKRFVSSAYAGDDIKLNAQEFYAHLGDQAYACYFRPIGDSYNVQPNKNAMAYTFVFRIRLKPNNTSSDLVIIDVNDSYFSNALAPIRMEEQEQRVLLQGAQGNYVAEMSAAPAQRLFSVKAGSQEVDFPGASGAGTSGSLTYRSAGRYWFTTYVRSEKVGWTFYNILPYQTVLAGLVTPAVLTLTMTLLTLAFGYMLSCKLSAHLYQPIKALYEDFVDGTSGKKGNELELLSRAFSEMYSKVDELERGLIASFHESKNLYLRALLHGEEERVRAAGPAYQRLGIDLQSPYYGVVCLECVPQQAAAEEEGRKENLFISYYALENITRELMAPAKGIEFLRTGENHFAVLLFLQENQLNAQLHKGLDTIAELMPREFHIDVSICVGQVVDSWTDINLVYEQEQIALHARTASHYGRVFSTWDVPEAMSSNLYDSSLHARLADHVRSGDMDACAGEFDQALAAMKEISFKSARTYFRHVLMSVLDVFFAALERDDGLFTQMMERLDSLDGCENVRALRTVFLGLLSSLSHQLSVERKNSNQDAALRAKEYIDHHFADPSLSLRMLAEYVQLSPAYLGKVFAAVTTFTFNDYVNHIRLTKAAQMLQETRLPVGKISEEVGILNTNYFYALFKKRYGMTPSAYRKAGPGT